MQTICPNCLIILENIDNTKTKINSPLGYIGINVIIVIIYPMV